MTFEFCDRYHRWEPLAEFNFYFDEDEESYDKNYVYCLCSRTYSKDGVKTYYAEKGCGSESDAEVVGNSHSHEVDDSHVHFSLDTPYKVKCEKDEGASCYCSASHTDYCCSTDELDTTQNHGFSPHALQPSDSGADLTYQDCHSDYTTLDKIEKMEQDFLTDIDTNENYLSDSIWEQFWASNGERIIWASWIKKYSDYINPCYLNENNEVSTSDGLAKQDSVEPIYNTDGDSKENVDDSRRERKFSYDSKINPYKKGRKEQNFDMSNDKIEDEAWVPAHRRRSCSEHDRIVSPKTLPGTDSMTNVTKMTLSSYNVTSSHVTSDSTPTDDYSVTSSSSDDQFNDQTRIINIEENTEKLPAEEIDTEQYWQFLWKNHFSELYAIHYANFLEAHQAINKIISPFNTNIPESKVEELKCLEVECENSEGNSQEMPSVIEVQAQIDQIKLEENVVKPKRRTKKVNSRVITSVGFLLQNLINDQKESELNDEMVDGADGGPNNDKTEVVLENSENPVEFNIQKVNNLVNCPFDYGDGDDDPPEERPISLKRSHEEDEIEQEKISSTLEVMGYSVDRSKMPRGRLIYAQKFSKLRPPRYKRPLKSKKTYFDDLGNPYQINQSQNSEDDDVLTDEDGPEIQSDVEQSSGNDKEDENEEINKYNMEEENIKEGNVSSEENIWGEDNEEEEDVECTIERTKDHTNNMNKYGYKSLKEFRRSQLPKEMHGDLSMYKYWEKRYLLFHRYDEGIRLDKESWFSVTPESVARDIANKYTYKVVVDAFCGAGGNTIQFAKTSELVIAIDIDPVKIEMARHNASIYGVADRIQFIVGDFFKLAHLLSGDMVFLSPPWGGPGYIKKNTFNIETMLEPKPASELVAVASKISKKIAIYLPRTSCVHQIVDLARKIRGSVEIEQCCLKDRRIALVAYYF